MILTCPQCGTRYFLPDVQVGRGGRPVKCTNCGNVWRAEAVEPEPAAPSHHFPPEPDPEPEPPKVFADPEEEFAAAAQRRAEILRQKKADTERRQRQAGVITAAVWAGLVAAVAILLTLAVIFRIQVVRWWPGTASAYAALHMPVNASGLLIDKVQAAPAIVQGHRSLMVTGVLTNASAAPRPTPAFNVNVLDKAGKPLAQRLIQVPAVALKVGEARRFQLQVADPPPGAENVEVTLALPPAPPAKTSPGKP
ncbi:MAG: DUF3426 domain-containing protein [Caulobacteraceae bacterium]